MGCFIVPGGEAVVTTVITKCIEKTDIENKEEVLKDMKYLNTMLWAGSAVLAVEHVINGELSPVFPFLTRLTEEGGAAVLLNEMATVGVMMAIVVTLTWMLLVAYKHVIKKNDLKVSTSLLMIVGVVLMFAVDFMMV